MKVITSVNSLQTKSFQINIKLILIISALVVLSIFQDLISSRLQDTGFYLSESFLYNTIWLFCIPFLFLQRQLLKRLSSLRFGIKLMLVIVLALFISLIHITIFATVFCAISKLSFTIPHRFNHMFNAALSNQLYLIFFFYVIAPIIFGFWKEKVIQDQNSYLPHIMVSHSLAKVKLDVSKINYISTDKPYSVINTEDAKYYDDRSLKQLQNILDPKTFRRVHKSFILNRFKVNKVLSRKNGDYDAVLSDNLTVRLSRHLRSNWNDLLLH